MEAHDQSLGAIPCSADCWDEDSPTTLRSSSTHRRTTTLALLRVSFASHRALMAHAMAAHAAVSFASRFIFDVYCPCCLTLFRTRQRVHEHLVDGKRRCLHALAFAVRLKHSVLVASPSLPSQGRWPKRCRWWWCAKGTGRSAQVLQRLQLLETALEQLDRALSKVQKGIAPCSTTVTTTIGQMVDTRVLGKVDKLVLVRVPPPY